MDRRMSATFGRVTCPRCGLEHVVPWPTGQGADCTCYKICPDGTGNFYPHSGCSWTIYEFSGQLDAQNMLDTAVESLEVDKLHITGYCSAHNRYIHKVPIFIEMDWDEWFLNPPPDAYRGRKAKGVYR
jgi:hypothetical protein